MPPSIDAQIRAPIEEFTNELSVLVQQAAMEAVKGALEVPADAPVRRGPGRPRKAKAARKKAGRRPGRPRAAKAGRAKTAAKAGKRIRRTAEDLEALAGKVLAYVKANAGARMEEISAGLRMATKDLGRPVASLVEAGRLRTEGQRRGTRYYAGGGKGPARKKAGKAKKAGRKKAKTRKKAAKRKSAKTAKRGGRKKTRKTKVTKRKAKRRTTKATAVVAPGAAQPG